MSSSKIDGAKSFETIKKQVDNAVKSGGLSRREAHSVISGAREGYRKRNYDRIMDSERKS